MFFIKVHSSIVNEIMLVRGDLILKITDALNHRVIEFTCGETEYVTETLTELTNMLNKHIKT